MYCAPPCLHIVSMPTLHPSLFSQIHSLSHPYLSHQKWKSVCCASLFAITPPFQAPSAAQSSSPPSSTCQLTVPVPVSNEHPYAKAGHNPQQPNLLILPHPTVSPSSLPFPVQHQLLSHHRHQLLWPAYSDTHSHHTLICIFQHISPLSHSNATTSATIHCWCLSPNLCIQACTTISLPLLFTVQCQCLSFMAECFHRPCMKASRHAVSPCPPFFLVTLPLFQSYVMSIHYTI